MAIALMATGAEALELAWPDGTVLTARSDLAVGVHSLPSGGFDGAQVPILDFEGQGQVRTWTIPAQGQAGPFLVFDALAGQIEEQGFGLVFRCTTDLCGGFDFRREVDALPPPAMFVDLADFYFLTGVREKDETVEAVSLWVSRAARQVTVQLTHVVPAQVADLAVGPAEIVEDAPVETLAPKLETDPSENEPGPLWDTLTTQGRAVLEDLRFEAGSSSLGGAIPASLQRLAEQLQSNPDKRIVIVGHTDATGSTATNMQLSKARARAVASVLTGDLGVPSAQVRFDGVGYLVPRHSNETELGRKKNRRVEVMILPD
ncbi:MAG: OmpA family protein [Pseudomonadota bacterium]